MRRVYRVLLLSIFLIVPSSIFAADLNITCYENQKPSISLQEAVLFDLKNFVPGQTSIRSVKVENTDQNNNCRIYFKGEGNVNILTNNVNIAIENIFGNIVDSKATTNRSLSDFLNSERIKIADLNPNQTVERDILLTFNPLADNQVTQSNTNFDIRIISEWGNEISETDQTEVLGAVNSKQVISRVPQLPSDGIGGAEEDSMEEVKGTDICENEVKVAGFVYLDINGDHKKQDREPYLPDIKLNIYTVANGEQQTVLDLTTNEVGYWKSFLCPGEYSIEIDRTSLPKNTNIENNIIDFKITDDMQYKGINIPIQKDATNFAIYWILILIVVVILLIATTVYIYKRIKRSIAPKIA